MDFANDPGWEFFISGRAHVYYGLLASIAIVLLIFFGHIDKRWIVAVPALNLAVFSDLWAHGYQH